MLNSETKRHIDAARDVLVGVAPNPTTQIDQITYALIYKFMDDMDQASLKAGGEASFFVGDLAKYAWSNLMSTRMGNQEKMDLYSEALTKFSEAKQLPELFRTIFRAAFLPYRSPETLGLFLKEISYFDYTHPEELGNAYEYLLSIMSSQGDAGQFRTPRHIIDFIVDVINPTKDDKVLDPACGTGGFLVSTYNHILEQHDGKDDPKKKEKPLTPDERKKLMSNLHGYDIDPTMVRIAQVNMFLHQFKNPQIFQYDSLTSEERWNDKYDVILANPPFMSPKGGIKPHNKFGVASNRAEVLFVDYIMNHLKPKGRAGIVVPEGIIFQSGKAYKELRKNLVENGLYAVVSLPGGVFQPYSGVKTSILLLNNELAKEKNEIAFVKISADGFDLGATKRPITDNDLPNALEFLNSWRAGNIAESPLVSLVSKKEVSANGDYNLSGERYKVGADYSLAHWPIVSLGAIATVQKGSSITQKDTMEGNIPVVAGGQKPAYFHNSANRTGNVITVSASGAYAGFVNYFEGPIFASDCSTIQSNDNNIALTRYIFFVLKGMQEEIYKLQQGGGQPHVYPKDLVTIEIPLPPLEFQEQIVSELEAYAAIISGSRQIVDNWKPNIPKEASWKVKKIEDVCQIGDGNHSSKYPKSSEMLDEGVIFIRSLNMANGELNSSNLKYISSEKHKELRKGHLQENDVLITNRGEIGKVALVTKHFDGANLNSQIAWLRPGSEIMPNFLLYSLLSPELQTRFRQLTQGSTLQQLTIKQLSQIEISLPSIEVQDRLVREIDDEKNSVEVAKKLVKLFEARTQDTLKKLWTSAREG